MISSLWLSVVSVLATNTYVQAPSASIQAGYLRCENLVDPLGLQETSPRLSWEVSSKRRGQAQGAYRILVASNSRQLGKDQGNLWDSGKVSSSQSTQIEYAGQALRSHLRSYWKVRLWDSEGRLSRWSKPATWSTGPLTQGEWGSSDWIGADRLRENAAVSIEKGKAVVFPSVLLRSGFSVQKKLKLATLYATGLGWYDVHLNGKQINDSYFNSGWTDYAKRVYYRTYDVTRLMKRGSNAWGAELSDGWFCGYIGFSRERNLYGKQPRLRMQLHLEFADGTEQDLGTGSSWKAALGPVIYADILKGESFDARRNVAGWDTAGFADSGWQGVDTGAEVSPVIQPHPGPAVRVAQEFRAKSVSEPKPHVYVFNLRQNFAGVVRLKVHGTAGQKITLRHAERLNPDGTIYTTNLRSATATDSYICRGDGIETWSPRFTFHGFQYVEITGLDEKPGADAVTGLALSSDTPLVCEFNTDDPMLNQLHSNILWTQRSNFIDVPTDCPQRDERLGWTGDAQVYVRTATQNTDTEAFYTKWLVDLEDAQRGDGQFPMVAPLKVAGDDGGPAWADAGVICPWTVYDVYKDKRELAKHYDAMCRFIEFCRNRSTPDLLPPDQYHCFGDWLNINDDTPHEVIYTAYFAYSTHLTAKAAEALGKTEDAQKWNELFEGIKAAFNKAYVGPDGRIKGDTQTAYVLPLAFDLLDAEHAKLAADYLVDHIKSREWHLSTGFIGTKDLMLVLAKTGHNDVALRLLHNDTFPSWGFSIKHGATSIWERWDGWTPEHGFQDPGMNSFAHYSFGAVYQWMVENLGGIRSDGPGYDHIVIVPTIDPALKHAHVGYRSVHGWIRSDWRRKGKRVVLSVRIPANTTAEVGIPASSVEAVGENGQPLSKSPGVGSASLRDGRVWVKIESGDYHFAF